jgi:alkylation response protein AidB-like acyl-CoA dehydrogenase
MRLDLSDDQQFFQETVRRYVETEMPVSSVRELFDTDAGFEPSWWSGGAELGWTSFLVPEEVGGGSISGRGAVDLAIVAEEIGRGVAPGTLLPVNVVAGAVARAGTADQHEAVLPGLISGEGIAAWCFNEPGRGWEPADIELSASAAGDGFVLSGTKVAVEAGAQADTLLVTARTDAGLTQFLLPADRAGVAVTAMSSLDLSKRFAEVRFDNVEVAAGDVLGTVGGADDDVQYQLNVARMLQCAESAGAIARVFEFTTEYAFDRFSFGRPLASYQALKHRFADMKLWLEAIHGTSDGAAAAIADDRDAARLVSVAKAYVGDRGPEIIQDCVQMHGGIGVTWEHDIHLFLRRVTVNSGLFGTPDDHREHLATAVGI